MLKNTPGIQKSQSTQLLIYQPQQSSPKTNFGPMLNQKPFVKSVDDLIQNMRLHSNRVAVLGKYVFQKFADLFPGATTQSVDEFLNLHDLSKINKDRLFLKAYGYSHEELIAHRLFQVYGLSKDSLPTPLATEMDQLISEMNRIDREIAYHYFKSKGLLNCSEHLSEGAMSLLWIERLADLVDRSESPAAAEEFSRKMAKAHLFIQEPKLIEATQHLEEVYFTITEHLQPTLAS